MEGGAFHDALQCATEAVDLANALQAQAEHAEAQELLLEIRMVLAVTDEGTSRADGGRGES
jgi:hypothetical protein